MNAPHRTVQAEDLLERDLAVLDDVERFRLLTSSQLQQLHLADGRSPVAAARATNRTLTRLRRHGLLTTLQRRIGGVRAGSAGLVWYLTPAGARLQHQRRSEPLRRRRYSEPSRHFVTHTLAVADAAIQIRSAASTGRFELLRLRTEPDNWQPSLTAGGVATVLKPDLLVVTASGDYEQHWFLEIDLATEHLPAIRRQHDAYRHHRASGRYQAAHGVYPLELWVVPTPARAHALAAVVGRQASGGASAVCTSDQLLTVLTRGS